MKSTKSTVTSHSHSNKLKDNTVSNPITGFCGNTVTTITKDGKEYSFWGGDSVEITSILINLDLSDSVCECSPEFMVDIEIYVDRIASMRIRDFNVMLEITRNEVINRYDPDSNDLTLRTIEAAAPFCGAKTYAAPSGP